MDERTRSTTETCGDALSCSALEWTGAEQLAQSGPELSSLVANEIHPPMECILETVLRLLETDLTGEQRILAEKLQRSGNALLTTINNLIDLSRIESGEMRLQEIDFALHTTLAQVKKQFVESGRGESPKVTCLVHHDVPAMLRGDAGRLRQVLSNFLPFAMQLAGGEEPVLRARLIGRAENEVTIRFEVTHDTEKSGGKLMEGGAVSVPKERMEFAQRAPIPGLGFAICKRLAGLMSGKFGVESEPGKASTVWCSVRLHKPPELSPAQHTPRTDLRGLAVLAVVDAPSAQKNLLAQTLSWGMSCDMVPDTREALAMLHSRALDGRPYDLAILDMQQSANDGLELARAIQSDPAISAVRPVALIAVGLRGHAEEARLAGIAGYLTKPVGQSELYHCLTTVMGVEDRDALGETPAQVPLVTTHSLTEARGRRAARVLVTEDNVVNQMVAVRMLEKLGVHADVATNGREALKACAGTAYDLILMDCQMPEMDGFEATRAILDAERARGKTHVPIVAVTAHAMKGDKEKCLLAGMDDYISKPFDLAQVRNLLARWTPALFSANSVLESSSDLEQEMPVDTRALESLRPRESDGAPDFLKGLVTKYVREARERLTTLHETGENANAGALRQAAHSLKGSSSVMGATHMATLCAELEEQIQLEEMQVARALVSQLEVEFERVREELQAQALRQDQG